MVFYSDLEYWLLIPKSFEVILLILLSIKIVKLRNYLLNQIFCAAFLSWTIYILHDIIVWIIAANSLQMYQIANLLRDLGIIGAMATAFWIYLAINIIQKGEGGLTRKFVITVVIIFSILTILLVIVDRIDVIDENGQIIPLVMLPPAGYARVIPVVTTITAVLSAFPMFVYFYAIYSIIHMITTKIDDPKLKFRMFLLTLGIAVIPMGMLYFLITSFLGLYGITVSTIGHLLWTSAPILIWSSQKKD